MSRIKVVQILSHVRHSKAFEWMALDLKKHAQIHFLLLNPASTPLEKFLITHQVSVKRIHYSGKADALFAWLKVFWFLIRSRPRVVHAHLFDAQLIGLSAAWAAGIKKRIYTRHNSTFHHQYFPKSVKYDKLSNWFSTQIVSISQATDHVLIDLEKVSKKKIVKIWHGFDLNIFSSIPPERVEAVRKKWALPSEGICVGVVARQVEWKGIQYIIPAFKKFLQHRPQACLIMANCSGPYQSNVLELLNGLPKKNVVMIPFEEDMAALYKSFDVYVHTPVDAYCEAFGQTYIEALASSLPSIFTLSGIAAEFVVHKHHVWVAQFCDSDSIFAGLNELTENDKLRMELIKNSIEALPIFELSAMLEKLKRLYGG